MTRHERLRVVVIALCVIGVFAAAINTTVGAVFIGALAVILMTAAVTKWVLS